VVLSEPVEWTRPLNPSNDSERLLFRQFLRTLTRVDCRGAVWPGIADSWSVDSAHHAWTFTLRQGARFPGGAPIQPMHVAGVLGGPEGKAAGIDSASVVDDRRLRVYGAGSVPAILAQPAFALVDGLASMAPLRRFSVPAEGGRPAIVFEMAENGDPRDAIDGGIDLVVTRDPAVVEYVDGRPEFITYPLPWSLTYILLQPTGASPLTPASGADTLRRSLARDAVRAFARPAEPPFWTDKTGGCGAAVQAPRPVVPAPRVVYPRDDTVARGLAERVVALADDPQLRTAPLAETDFRVALHQASDRAYVVAIPRSTMSPCREAAAWPLGASILPLIDTRSTAIVRAGSAPLSLDWDGTLRVTGEESSGDDR
jgi:hypothetical protein